MSKLETALEYYDAGWKFFQITDNSKVPLPGSKGEHDYFTDREQVIKAWTEYPNGNLAANPGKNGFAVVDLDNKDGQAESKRLKWIEAHGDTFTISTPNGGYHLWLKGWLPKTESTLEKGTDTRGEKGYVVLAGSTINGKDYEAINECGLASVPVEVAARIARPDNRVSAATGTLDLAVNRAIARNVIDGTILRDGICREDGTGEPRTLQLAQTLLDHGLSREVCLTLMLDHWNPNCVPPWSRDELAGKIENAWRYRQNDPGCYAVSGPTEEVFAEAVKKLETTKLTVAPVDAGDTRPRFWSADSIRAMPDPEMLIDNLLVVGNNICFFGPPGVGKSLIAFDVAFSLAAKIKVLKQFEGFKFGPIIYLSGEGHGGIKLRLLAFEQGRQVVLPADTFHYSPDVPMVLQFAEEAKLFVDKIQASFGAPVLVVIDTMSRSLAGLDEDAKAANDYLTMTERIRTNLKCTVITIAHSGKDIERGIRGSSAALGGFDAVFQIEQNENSIVKLQSTKIKDGPRIGPHCFRVKTLRVEGMGPKVNQGAVLEPVPVSDFENKVTNMVQYSGKEVIAPLLAKLKALDKASAKPTAMLVNHLYHKAEHEDEEQFEFRKDRARRDLNLLAKSKLEVFAFKDEGQTMWCLPSSGAG